MFRASTIHWILTALIRYLGQQYLEGVLDSAITALADKDRTRDDDLINKANYSQSAKQMALNSDKIAEFLSIVRQITQNVVLFLEHFQSNIVSESSCL
jgi:hypothetical protein